MSEYPVLNRLSKVLRKSGKRTVSDRLITESALILKSKGYTDPYKTRVDAIEILKPMVELRTQKKSGQAVQVPSARTPSRQEGMALRMLKAATNEGSGSHSTSARMANEFHGIRRGEGSTALRRQKTLHRRAIAQRGARN